MSPAARLRRISWGAVIAGVVIILAIQLMLALLGAGIGLSTVSPVSHETPEASTFGTAATIYWGICTLLSVLAGGWVAGRLAGVPRDFDGAIHGVLAWGGATLLTVYLLSSSIGSLIGGAFSVVGSVARGATEMVAASVPAAAGAIGDTLEESGIDLDRLKQEAVSLMKQTDKPELRPENLAEQAKNSASDAMGSAGTRAAPGANSTGASDFDSLWTRIFQRGKGIVDAADRDALVNVVAARSGQSREQAEAKAREAAERSASIASRASLSAFLALVLGAVAGGVGGRMGRPQTALF